MNTKIFERIMAINVLGSVYVAKYASVAMAATNKDESESGLILFTSSVAAEEGQRNSAGYSASKGAINGLVMPMARDLGRYKIRVAAIAPGIFDTPMYRAMPKKMQAGFDLVTPMKRLGRPEEFSHAVKFCIENGYINGVSLRIDGATKLSHL